MTKQVYDALKERITKVTNPDVINDYRNEYPSARPDGILYHFNAEGLNEGLQEYDIDYIDDIIHEMNTTNMWNVCQRFRWLLRNSDIDNRLLNA